MMISFIESIDCLEGLETSESGGGGNKIEIRIKKSDLDLS